MGPAACLVSRLLLLLSPDAHYRHQFFRGRHVRRTRIRPDGPGTLAPGPWFYVGPGHGIHIGGPGDRPAHRLVGQASRCARPAWRSDPVDFALCDACRGSRGRVYRAGGTRGHDQQPVDAASRHHGTACPAAAHICADPAGAYVLQYRCGGAHRGGFLESDRSTPPYGRTVTGGHAPCVSLHYRFAPDSAQYSVCLPAGISVLFSAVSG